MHIKKKKLTFLLFLIGLICISSSFYFLTKKRVPEAVITSGNMPDMGKNVKQMTAEELEKFLQEKADKNYINLEVNPNIYGQSKNKEVTLQIVNPKQNVFPISVEILDDSTNKTIAKTGAIQPTQYVENEQLLSTYEAGEYPVTFIVSIYNEMKEKKGETQIAGMLIIT